jgi:hypothetical protein
MTKVEINSEFKSPSKSGAKLDTLEQPRKGLLSKGCGCDNPLQKRSLKKAITQACVIGKGNGLVDVEGSKLTKQYWTSHYCSHVMLQKGKKVSSTYCKRRWCLVCNSIRTANLILGYSEVFESFQDPQMVTLTRPNVKAEELETTIRLMNTQLKQIRDRLRKQGIKVKGIRKHETTYNADTDEYHPHFHLIVEGRVEAFKIKMGWLESNPKALFDLQKVEKADSGTMMEVFKYVTKVVAKGKDGNPKHYPKAMDVIYTAYFRKRVVQSFGITKKAIEEKVTGNIEHNYLPSRMEIFCYETEAMDWVSGSGEVLSEYTPTKKVIDLVSHLIQKE